MSFLIWLRNSKEEVDHVIFNQEIRTLEPVQIFPPSTDKISHLQVSLEKMCTKNRREVTKFQLRHNMSSLSQTIFKQYRNKTNSAAKKLMLIFNQVKFSCRMKKIYFDSQNWRKIIDLNPNTLNQVGRMNYRVMLRLYMKQNNNQELICLSSENITNIRQCKLNQTSSDRMHHHLQLPWFVLQQDKIQENNRLISTTNNVHQKLTPNFLKTYTVSTNCRNFKSSEKHLKENKVDNQQPFLNFIILQTKCRSINNWIRKLNPILMDSKEINKMR